MMYEDEIKNGVISVSGYDARIISDKIIKELSDSFPYAKISAEGKLSSYNKIKDAEECNEIEILFGFQNDEDINEMCSEISETLKSKFNVEPEIGSGAFKGEISFTYNDGEVSVPVSISVTNNYDWSRGFGRTEKSTNFSETLKDIILNEMVAVSPLSTENLEGHNDEFFKSDDEENELNGLPITQWKHSLDKAGGKLELVKRQAEMNKNGLPRTRKGANGNLVTRWAPISDRKELTRNFSEAIKIIGGPKARWTDFTSIENMLKFIFSDRYGYPEKINELKTKIDNRLARSSAGMDGDVEQFNELWNKYMQEEQNISGELNEGRLNKFAMAINNLTARMNLL